MEGLPHLKTQKLTLSTTFHCLKPTFQSLMSTFQTMKHKNHSIKNISWAGAIKFKVGAVYVCHSKQNIYICIWQASPLGGRVKTYRKGVYFTLCVWRSEILRKFQTISQKQSNGRCPIVCIYTVNAIFEFVIRNSYLDIELYTYSVGLRRCSFRLIGHYQSL